MEIAPLNQQLCFSLYSASLAVGRACKPHLDRLGITYPQYLVMMALWEEDGRTIGSIATRLGLDSSTVTPLVKRLEACGLLGRARNPVDERQVLVTLSGRGRAMRAECGIVGETLIALTGFDQSRFAQLNRDVQALRDALSRAPAELSPAP